MGLGLSRAARTSVVALAVGALGVTTVGTAAAAPGGVPGRPDTTPVAGDYNKGRALPLDKPAEPAPKPKKNGVGEVRSWLALDDGGTRADGSTVPSRIYLKDYTLRGVGDHIELWVSNDVQFLDGDCRNTVGGGEAAEVTDQQVKGFVKEFDRTMYPAESAAFSVAPDRDGTDSLIDEALDLGADYWKGAGDKTVVLVDNVRDQNYYDPTAADGRTYIAGFFYSVFNEYLDRNIMTIDAFDWAHRTGRNPKDDSADADYVSCSEYLGRGFGDARPRLYEGTFAHEYQHLLEYYADTDETTWVNEGLSDWAQTLVGYVDPSLSPDDDGADGHLSSFLGFNPGFGGPEQSLTRWQDQGATEILSDYGMVYAFMEHVHSRFGGDAFMSFLHDDDRNGLAGLQAALDEFGHDTTAQQVLHDFLASMAVDQALDGGATVVTGTSADRLQTSSMSAKVNWDDEQAYASPGAPTNGADYVRLRSASGSAVSDGAVTFQGSTGFPARPVEWVQQDGALFSGAGNGFDRGITRAITVPEDAPSVTLDLDVQTEALWDFAFVQVYDAATGEWVSLANDATSTDADPAADPAVEANLPGFSGTVTGPQTFDLSAYAGQTVDLAVRYITDGAVVEPGVRLLGMSVGGTPVADATELSAWQSLTQAHPEQISGWTVQLVGISGTSVSVVEVPLTSSAAGWTWSGDVSDTLGFTPETAAALVTVDDPTELANQYGSYALTVDGALQPGGGTR